jgi:hypothetical protein
MENYDQWRLQRREDDRSQSRAGYEDDDRGRGRRDFGDNRSGGEQRDSRDRDDRERRPDEPSRGGPWRGDQNRTTTEEQRERGFEPRESERFDWSRSSGHGLYGSDDPRRDDRDSILGRDDEQQTYYRGYYNRSVTPYEYPGGRGNLYTESWTITGPHTGRGPKGYKRSDEQIVEEASLRLERSGQVDATDIEVSAEDGVIRLRGTVPDRSTKRRAEECVESVYGARDVMNELRVTTASSGAAQNATASQGAGTPPSASSERSTASSSSSAQPSDDEKAAKGSASKPRH